LLKSLPQKKRRLSNCSSGNMCIKQKGKERAPCLFAVIASALTVWQRVKESRMVSAVRWRLSIEAGFSVCPILDGL
ncbi:MAG: hypothetical protein P8X63_07975, partial [Desulfuromonadaceae bacterium]